jgi:hypothetical protein
MSTDLHTGEPSICGVFHLRPKAAIEKLERYKSPGIDPVPTQLVAEGDETIYSEIHKLRT